MKRNPINDAGLKLKITRLRLLLSRKNVHNYTGISISTIERIENGDTPYPEDDFKTLLKFYDYTEDEIYSIKSTPDWIELRRKMSANHRNNEEILKFFDKKPNAQNVLKYRVLTSKILNNFITVNYLKVKIQSTYNWTYSNSTLQNALNSLVEKKILTRSTGVPAEYCRASNKLSNIIDPYFELSKKLEQLNQENKDNLVNPAYRRMAIISYSLKDGQKSRKELLELAGIKNETNNVKRTISVLQNMNIIQKTELAPKSSKQKYELTENGKQMLRELDIL